ncbi:hypothetical protein, conserved [Babesia bigemina]|uniref:Uncharacterized protein n=1 Tax=Babesia bigemina TaxID=5866 RepID=A0A061D4H5_BABBI|nr:hypothetical protein, conserved [Babesia bigemina]CDR93834.1 hypothetical protein, conserved [Babesia bigemina]|eukprot:XP_012766020.1 hypothetical protein, conserved [Babesia bigemina]
MGRSGNSAAYFERTPEVDEFLGEFVRVRTRYLLETARAAKILRSRAAEAPYRRLSELNPVASHEDDVPNDEMIDAAREMEKGKSINLDAFIRLVVSHHELCDSFDDNTNAAIQPRRFELYQIMMNTTIKNRKALKLVDATDLKSALREAEERRYQRLVADVSKKLKRDDKTSRPYRPPIIGGINAIVGVFLVFVGAYSVAGVIGVKDVVKRAVIAAFMASAALLVDTLLFVMRCER